MSESSLVVVAVNRYIRKDRISGPKINEKRKAIKDGKILYYVHCLTYISNDATDDVAKIVLKIYLFKLHIIRVYYYSKHVHLRKQGAHELDSIQVNKQWRKQKRS